MEHSADTIAGCHAEQPEMFSEEYQAEMLIRYIELLRTKPFVIGEHVWNLCDFKTGQSVRRVAGLNLKGVFTNPLLIVCVNYGNRGFIQTRKSIFRYEGRKTVVSKMELRQRGLHQTLSLNLQNCLNFIACMFALQIILPYFQNRGVGHDRLCDLSRMPVNEYSPLWKEREVGAFVV